MYALQKIENMELSVFANELFKYKSTKFMHYHTYTKPFNSLVCPITEYGAGIWGLGEFENIILLTACRTYLGAHRHVAKTCLVPDMGWLSDYNRRQVEVLSRVDL